MATEAVVKAMLAAFAQNWPEKADHCQQQDTIAFWHRHLQDMDDGLLRAAAKTVLCEAKYFPRVADLREMAFRLQKDMYGIPEAEEAWGIVTRWLRATSYVMCSDGMARKKPPLPVPLRKAVDAIGGLEALSLSENATADRARFIAAYERTMARAQHEATMLPEVRELVQRAALPEGLRGLLPEGEHTTEGGTDVRDS